MMLYERWEFIILDITNDDKSLVLRNSTQILSDENKCYPILQSDFTVNICKWIIELKNAEIDSLYENKMKVLLDNDNKIELELDNNILPEHLNFADFKKVKSAIRVSQAHLFQWILFKYNMKKNKIVNINIEEYFNAKGLDRRKSNVDNLLEDLFILSQITITANLKFKGNIEFVTNKLMTFKGYIYNGKREIEATFIPKKKLIGISIELGEWIEKIKINQYVYMHEDFFKYNCKNENNAVMLSIKFAQLIRTNIAKLINNEYYNCSIETILKFLNISKNVAQKQGTKHYIKIIKNSLKSLAAEGYIFKFDIKEKVSFDDFLKIKIYYKNQLILDKYQNIKKKRPKNKKSKKKAS